jgi:CHAD domain-containing protein
MAAATAPGVSGGLERERKLDVGSGFAFPELAGVRLRPRRLVSTYYDTADHRLARAGVTLRYRQQGSRGSWQLKLPQAEHRLELEAQGDPESPPAELTDLLAARVRGGALAPVATLETRRTGVRADEGGRAVAEVTLDAVAVKVGGEPRGGFSELEIELLADGTEADLDRLAAVLCAAGARPGDGMPKLVRVLGLDGERPEPAPSGTEALLAAMLSRQYEAMLRHDPGTRLGQDPEELHDFRVAVRRLRAITRAAAPVLDPERTTRLRDELRWLASALGDARDMDVLIEHLRADAASLGEPDGEALQPLVEGFERDRERARETMLAAMRSDRYLELLRLLEHETAAPPVVDPGADLSAIAAEPFAKLRKAARRAGREPDDPTLHRLRIKGKRARYAAEMAQPLLGKRGDELVRAAKAFQDVLGEHQDAVVAEERLRAAAGVGSHELALACGRLVERQRRRRESTRAEWRDAWKALRRAGKRAWPSP